MSHAYTIPQRAMDQQTIECMYMHVKDRFAAGLVSRAELRTAAIAMSIPDYRVDNYLSFTPHRGAIRYEG